MKARCLLQTAAFTLLLITAACKEEQFTPLNFDAVTRTNDSCAILGQADPTDFTHDLLWTNQEESVMSFKNTQQGADSLAGNIQVLPICKNPSNGQFSFEIRCEKACKIKLAFVNYEMDILHYATFVQDSGQVNHPFNFVGLSSFRPNKNYRLYYSMSNSLDSVYYRGHGDFRIEQE